MSLSAERTQSRQFSSPAGAKALSLSPYFLPSFLPSSAIGVSLGSALLCFLSRGRGRLPRRTPAGLLRRAPFAAAPGEQALAGVAFPFDPCGYPSVCTCLRGCWAECSVSPISALKFREGSRKSQRMPRLDGLTTPGCPQRGANWHANFGKTNAWNFPFVNAEEMSE